MTLMLFALSVLARAMADGETEEGLVTVAEVRSVLVSLVEQGILSHRQANIAFKKIDLASHARVQQNEISVGVTVDGTIRRVVLTPGVPYDKTAADFCLSNTILQKVEDCVTIRNHLIDKALSIDANALSSSNVQIAGTITEPPMHTPYTSFQFSNQRIYFNITSRTAPSDEVKKSQLCYHIDYNQEPVFCNTHAQLQSELTYLPRQSFTRPSLENGWHILHLRPRGSSVSLVSPSADARFFYVASPSIKIIHAGFEEERSLAQARVLLSDFRPSVDGAVCMLIDYQMSSCFGNAAEDKAGISNHHLSFLYNKDSVQIIASKASGFVLDMEASVHKDLNEFVITVVLLSGLHHAKAVALSDELRIKRHSRHQESSRSPRLTIADLSDAADRNEWGIYSQNGEDGIILSTLQSLGMLYRPGYAVEFGVEDGSECNTRLLMERFNWSGLLMDGGYSNKSINLHKEFISAENINSLFHKYGVPAEFELLSIDLDFNDWHVLHSILKVSEFKPKIIVIEFNSHVPPEEARTVVYNGSRMWDGKTDYSGASVSAISALGKLYGYHLFYVESHGVNCFLMHESLVQLTIEDVEDKNGFNAAARLFRSPNYFGRNLSYPHDDKGKWMFVA